MLLKEFCRQIPELYFLGEDNPKSPVSIEELSFYFIKCQSQKQNKTKERNAPQSPETH